MKTFPIYDEQNRLLAFEVGVLFLGRRRVINTLEGVEGVETTYIRPLQADHPIASIAQSL